MNFDQEQSDNWHKSDLKWTDSMWFVQFTQPVNRGSVWGRTGGMESDLGYIGKLVWMDV